jgi:hypothetical protein
VLFSKIPTEICLQTRIWTACQDGIAPQTKSNQTSMLVLLRFFDPSPRSKSSMLDLPLCIEQSGMLIKISFDSLRHWAHLDSNLLKADLCCYKPHDFILKYGATTKYFLNIAFHYSNRCCVSARRATIGGAVLQTSLASSSTVNQQPTPTDKSSILQNRPYSPKHPNSR